MKKLILLLVASALFLGGYYLGGQPGRPDIFAWASQQWRAFNESGGREKVSQTLDSWGKDLSHAFSTDAKKDDKSAQDNQIDNQPAQEPPQAAAPQPPTGALAAQADQKPPRRGIPQCW